MFAILPLLLLSAQPEIAREASSYENIGNTIATARVCAAFGYDIDREGLADWAAASRDALARRDASLTGEEAHLQIERHVVSSFARDYRRYWEQASRDGRNADQAIDNEYRYVNLQRKACDRLARSDTVGGFVVPPAKEPAASTVIARVRAEFSRMKLDR